ENWLKDRKLILKKTANGRFTVVGEVRDLAELEKNKFSVLGDIRSFKIEDAGLDPTLSIGVGTGDSFAECEERAKKALEMALGRGGDQAAVYTPDGHVYYGGVSDRMTDNSRVSPRKTSANMATVFKKYETVLIQGHTFSDYDAVGAAVGLQHLCTLCGVKAYTVLDEKTTLAGPLVSYLIGQGYGGFISPRDALEICDESVLLASVDVHRPAIFDCPQLCERCGAQIVIDHHRRAEDAVTGAEIFYHLPGASSASEMVAELIEYSTVSGRLPAEIATALMAGIVLDTRNFVLRTSQRTFEAAGFLRESGANTVLVKKLFSSSSDTIAAQYRILADAVNHNGFMISGTEEMRDDLRILTSKAANDMLDIEGVRASFVLSFIKPGEKVQISARSLGEENVQLIMEQLGGGGHNTMAAAQVECETLAQAKQQLLKAIDAYVKSK
ncbi:MAG: DHH family phosphoesterase, partial [Clostridia bacterium]|nr:DHH family phosphoesterase [Clostridia bacterium]